MIINEKHHNIVYGKTFSKLKKDQIGELVNNYAKRFKVNKINAKKIFKNKTCLDAGCGFGRGTIFMLSNSAKFVTSLDISDNNTKTAKKNLKSLGFKNFKIAKKNISNLPFKNETFDVVWCYGVIHHAKNTDKCLKEITRVLKKGGYLKLFVYGSGGVFWYVIKRFRKILSNFDTNKIINILNFLNYSEVDIVNFIDNWKTSYLRTYTEKDLNKRLISLGYENPKPHKNGLKYDSHERKKLFLKDRKWMGEGDLRYLIKKSKNIVNEENRLNNSPNGSIYNFDNTILRNLNIRFDKIEKKLKNNLLLSVIISAKINKVLLELLNSNKPFNSNKFINYIDKIINILK